MKRRFINAFLIGAGFALVAYLGYAYVGSCELAREQPGVFPRTQTTIFPPSHAYYAALTSIPISFPIGTALGLLVLTYTAHRNDGEQRTD